MKLSIIVAVYNMAAEGKLNYCMDSLVNQTLPKTDYEIIAVDDASPDNSVEILREYEAKYPGLVKVIVHEKNRRQGATKNTGIKAACGEWLAFVDSDDWVTPDCYEKLLKKAEETGADMVGCEYSLVTEHTMQVGKIACNNTMDQTGILDEEKHKKLFMRSGSMVLKIYKHDVIRDNGLCFPEGIFYEDNCAGPLWSLYFKQFERVDEPMYFYYQHQVSTVHHITEAKCRDRMTAAKFLVDECKERGHLEAYFPEIEFRFAELHLVNTLFSYMQACKKKKPAFVKQLRNEIMEQFPDFQQNGYYQQFINAEEKRLVAMMIKSPGWFYVYYQLLNQYRNLRRKLG